MNKRGILGLDTAKAFIMAILVIAMIAFAGMVILANLGSNAAGRITHDPVAIDTETITTLQESGDNFAVVALFDDPSLLTCTLTTVNNATGGEAIAADNYTQTNCAIASTAGAAYNNSNVLINYSYVYLEPAARDVTRNVTGGIRTFMSNSGTWFSLIAIVVIILIIAIVIVTVNRFGGSGLKGGSVDNGSL